MKYYVEIEGTTYEIDIAQDEVRVDGTLVAIDLEQSGMPELYSVLLDDQSHEVLVRAEADGLTVLLYGASFRLSVQDEAERMLQAGRTAGEETEGELRIEAPISGLVVTVPVTEGETVRRGQTLVVLEAMKMENEITAPRAGIVRDLAVEAGARVDMESVMMVLE